MALSTVSAASPTAVPAVTAAQLQAQARAAATVTVTNASLASAALESIVENATRTALIGQNPSFIANLEGATAPAAANAPARAASEGNRPAGAASRAENSAGVGTVSPASVRPARPPIAAPLVPTSPGEQAAELVADAQTGLVQRRIAQDIATAFNVVMTDQTYSAAATALYLSAATYRSQVDRPRETTLATPGPVQPIKALDAVPSSTDFSLGDSTTKA